MQACTYACDAVVSEPKGLGGSNIRSVSQGTVRTFFMRAEGSLCGTSQNVFASAKLVWDRIKRAFEMNALSRFERTFESLDLQ